MRTFGDSFDQTSFPFQNHESVMNTLSENKIYLPRPIFEVLLFPYPTSFHLTFKSQGATRNMCGEKTSTFTFCVVGRMCWQLKYGQVHFGEAGVAAFHCTKQTSGDKWFTFEDLKCEIFVFLSSFSRIKDLFIIPNLLEGTTPSLSSSKNVSMVIFLVRHIFFLSHSILTTCLWNR